MSHQQTSEATLEAENYLAAPLLAFQCLGFMLAFRGVLQLVFFLNHIEVFINPGPWFQKGWCEETSWKLGSDRCTLLYMSFIFLQHIKNSHIYLEYHRIIFPHHCLSLYIHPSTECLTFLLSFEGQIAECAKAQPWTASHRSKLWCRRSPWDPLTIHRSLRDTT